MKADTYGNAWHAAPMNRQQMQTGSITGAFAPPGMMVNWNWTHGLDGSYVNGYTLVPITEKKKDKKDEDKDCSCSVICSCGMCSDSED